MSGTDGTLPVRRQQYRDYLVILARTQMDERLLAVSDASDSVQQTLKKAHENLAGFRGKPNEEIQARSRGVRRKNLPTLPVITDVVDRMNRGTVSVTGLSIEGSRRFGNGSANHPSLRKAVTVAERNNDSQSNHERRLSDVLDAYLRAVESGETINRQAWLREHPDLSDDLELFLYGQDKLIRLAAPLRLAKGLEHQLKRELVRSGADFFDEPTADGLLAQEPNEPRKRCRRQRERLQVARIR